MANVELVDTELANLNIIDEEEDPMVVLGVNNDDEESYDLCLVGRVLTDSVVNFPSLRNTLADLWHPLRGVSITELENKRILFRFYSEIDLKRVLDGMPWFFSRHLIVFHRLRRGEEPNLIPLWHTVFWVQVHNLPVGVTSEGTARQLGDFVGKFMEYNSSVVTRGGCKFMRIRVLIDVRTPLKRKKRISMEQNKFIYALFQYERLPLFCFICGRLGHGESYCEARLTLGNQQVEFGWDLSLRATPRRGGQSVSKWLREEPGKNKGNDMDIDGERRIRRHLEERKKEEEVEDTPVEL
ncbi:hypothetical protein Golax_022759, partial [Gossypium laxum]|nr:hypothetical protein [Gossypium laxum]